MNTLSLRRGRALLAAVMSATLVVVGLIALPFLAAPAFADATGTTGPINVTVSPTTGLNSGGTISIDATATSGTMSDILVHVCDPGIVPVNQFKFTSDVYCPNVTLTGGDAGNIVDQTLANTTTGHVNFEVGTGHAHWIDGFNSSPPENTHDLDCDPTHSCLLVMQFSSNVAPGTFYFTAPLTYAAPLAVPGAPTLVTATNGDTTSVATWTAPANTGNGAIDQYTVTATRTGGTADPASPHVVVVPAPATSTTIPGLVNGATYDVSVVARNTDGAAVPAHFTSVPSNVLSVTPAAVSRFITQTIDVTRPQGDLVLTQACASPDPYPQDPITGLAIPTYPTNCTGVSLGIATLVKTGPQSGQYFEAHGAMLPVTVVDTRDGDPGWVASTSVSNFSDGTHTFSGNDLGFAPGGNDNSAPFTSPDGSYAQSVTAGATVAPITQGLASPATLASAPLGHVGTVLADPAGQIGGLGIAHLNAALNLLIPIFNHSGHYTATLTITAA